MQNVHLKSDVLVAHRVCKFEDKPDSLKINSSNHFMPNKLKYFLETPIGNIEFGINKVDIEYPQFVQYENEKIDVFWSEHDKVTDFCRSLLKKCQSINLIPYTGTYEEHEKLGIDCSAFEYFDLTKQDDELNYKLMVILKILQDREYLKVYHILPDSENPIWKQRASIKGKFGMILLKNSFEKDDELMNEIRRILK